MIIGKNRLLITTQTKLYSHQINNDFDMKTIVGEVAANPANPNLWGIRNLTKTNWTYIHADGKQIPVPPGRVAAIARNVKIDFGSVVSEFK